MKKLIFCASLFLAFSFTQAKADQTILIQAESATDRSFYDFGTVSLNFPQYIYYTITNTGDTRLNFQYDTSYGTQFWMRHSCAGGLEPKAKCRVSIQFSPNFEGYTTGSFQIFFDQDSSLRFDVSGWGRRD